MQFAHGRIHILSISKGIYYMVKFCKMCNSEYNFEEKKCPVCNRNLTKKCTEEELKEIQKKNDDFVVINTMLL